MSFELLFTDPYKIIDCDLFGIICVSYITEIRSRRR
jgi:hypothetical protein